MNFFKKYAFSIFITAFVIINLYLYIKGKPFLVGMSSWQLQILVIAILMINYFKRNFSKIRFILLLFIFYISFTNPTPSGDMIPARFAPYWMDKNSNFSFEMILKESEKKIYSASELNDFKNQITGLPHLKGDGYIVLPYYLVYFNEKYLPTYPLITLYYNYYFFQFVTSAFIDLPDVKGENWLESALPKLFIQEKLASSFSAVISCLLFFLILRRHPFSLSNRSSYLLTLVYALASSHFSNSSQALWQHSTIEVLVLAIFYIVQSPKLNSHFIYLILGILVSCLFFTRPNSVILLMFPLYYFYQKNNFKIYWKLIISTFIGFTTSFSYLSYLNFSYYQNIFGGYSFMKEAKATLNYPSLFSFPLWKGLLSILFSPGFGFFVFGSFFIFSFFYFRRNNKKVFGNILILNIVIYILFYSKYIFWEGGHSYGARFLTDINAYFLFLLAFSYPILKKSIKLYISFSILVIFSFFIQYTGAKYKNEISLWNSQTYNSTYEKAWDWKNTPFIFPYK